MKKVIALVVTAIVVSIGTVSVFAQAKEEKNVPIIKTQFTDEDADGVCDNAGQRACQGQGMSVRCGRSVDCGFFVEEDTDGFCDHEGQRSCKRQGACRNK